MGNDFGKYIDDILNNPEKYADEIAPKHQVKQFSKEEKKMMKRLLMLLKEYNINGLLVPRTPDYYFDEEIGKWMDISTGEVFLTDKEFIQYIEKECLNTMGYIPKLNEGY